MHPCVTFATRLTVYLVLPHVDLTAVTAWRVENWHFEMTHALRREAGLLALS